MNVLDMVEKPQLREGLTAFKPGDTLKVHVKIKEGDKERIQVFEGVCIAMKHSGIRETFTVRKISFGHGVERIFPLHSRIIDKIERVRSGRVRRAKLYYIRELRGKAARIKEIKEVKTTRRQAGRGSERRRRVMDDDRITPLGFIVFCLSIGAFLIVIPWHQLWEKNFLLAYVPALRTVALNNFVRGAVSGLGAVDVALGIVESARLVKSFRVARPSADPTPPVSE